MASMQKDMVILFLWQNEKTIVIGRHQNPYKECDLALMSKEGINLARRLSGGGTVYQDIGNLNYTFIGSSENYDVDNQMQLILKAVKTFGIPAELNMRNDLVIGGRKFSGNAFYNQDQFHCHHGTLLINAHLNELVRYLAHPEYEIESKGVSSVSSKIVNLKEFCSGITVSNMQEAIIKSFNDHHGSLAPVVMVGPEFTGKFMRTAVKKYESWDWTFSKTPSFKIAKGNTFDQGYFQITLTVKNGLVVECKIIGDLLISKTIVVLEDALVGQTFSAFVFCRQIKDNIEDKKLRATLCEWFMTWLCVPLKFPTSKKKK